MPRVIDLMQPHWAYFFGFCQADGHLWQGKGQKGKLSIELKGDDIALLDFFATFIPHPCRIYQRVRNTNFKQDYQSSCLTLSNLAFRQELKDLGFPTGKKSTIVAPPTVAFSSPDYFRGWIDADGSVGITGQGLPFVSFCTKSLAIASALESFAQEITGTPRGLKENKRDRVYNLMYTKEAAQKLVAVLYPENVIALQRKVEAAKKVLEWERPDGMSFAPPRKRWSETEDAIVLEYPVQEVAQFLGRTEKSVLIRAWRLHKMGSSENLTE